MVSYTNTVSGLSRKLEGSFKKEELQARSLWFVSTGETALTGKTLTREMTMKNRIPALNIFLLSITKGMNQSCVVISLRI
jgi:hypothetical protein